MRDEELSRKSMVWREAIRPYLREGRKRRIRLSPKESALLVIDMQRFFFDNTSHAYLPDGEAIIDNVAELLAAYRGLSLPVIFTRHALMHDEPSGAMGRWWGDVLYDDDPMSEIVPRLRPVEGEKVVRKTRYSAFAGTCLESELYELGVKQLVITGVMTHLCCETTARDAFVRDFDVFFVVDGTAARNEELHLSSLKTLSDGFAMPVEASEVISWLK